MGVQSNVVLVDILVETFRSKDLCNLDQLIIVVMSVKERFLAEDLDQVKRGLAASRNARTRADHRCKHATVAPHVEAIVVFLEVDEQLGALEVA